MLIKQVGDKELILRNLQEQVLQNKNDIQYILEEAGVLNEFGIRVIGIGESIQDLPDPVEYEGEFGDAYAIGTEPPYTLYIYTRANTSHINNWWFDIGLFPGPSTVPGPIGPQGIQGNPGIRGSLWYSQSGVPTNTTGVNPNDQALNGTNGDIYQFVNGSWQLTGNIRGPQGIQGNQGIQGIQGPVGPIGPQGPQGEMGRMVEFAGTLDNVGQLPAPNSVPRYYAYFVMSDEDNTEHVYVIIGTTEDSLMWYDAGSFGASGGTKVTMDGIAQSSVELGYVPKISVNYQIGDNTMVSSNGSEVTFTGLQTTGYNINNEQIEGVGTIELPIASSDEIIVDALNNTIQFGLQPSVWQTIESKIGDAKPEEIQISAPTTSTNGQLTADQMNSLQNNKGAYLMFNNEIYRLQDTQHISGYLVYTHIGYDNTSAVYMIKCITITISTRGWALTSRTVMNPANYSTTTATNTTIDNKISTALSGYVTTSTLNNYSTTNEMNTAINNAKPSNFAANTAGLVPAPTSTQYSANYYLKGNGTFGQLVMSLSGTTLTITKS